MDSLEWGIILAIPKMPIILHIREDGLSNSANNDTLEIMKEKCPDPSHEEDIQSILAIYSSTSVIPSDDDINIDENHSPNTERETISDNGNAQKPMYEG